MPSPNDIEIEHKFLVDELFTRELTEGKSITQGYLTSHGPASVRVRLIPSAGISTFTVKGPRRGDARLEYEIPVPEGMAELLLEACGGRIIEKQRFAVPGPDGKLWVVDVFHGANEGLVLAEIELDRSGEMFELPEWVRGEVTEDERYYNEFLADHPFTTW